MRDKIVKATLIISSILAYMFAITEVLLLLATVYGLAATGTATFFTILPYVVKTIMLVALYVFVILSAINGERW